MTNRSMPLDNIDELKERIPITRGAPSYLRGHVPYTFNIPPSLELKSGCQPPGIVAVCKTIDEDTYRAFARDLREQAEYTKCVVIVLDSPGGDVGFGLRMESLMTKYKQERGIFFVAVALRAYSMAAFVFVCGDFRIAVGLGTPVMIHDTNYSRCGGQKLTDLTRDASRCAGDRERMLARMSEMCGHEKSFFGELIAKNNNTDVILSTAQCLQYGLAHGSGVPRFQVNVSFCLQFEGEAVTSSEQLVDWIDSFDDGGFVEPWRRGAAVVGPPNLVESPFSSFTARPTCIPQRDVSRTYIPYGM